REAQTVWDRAVRIRVAGEEALGLCPEDLLLYLSTHLAVHHSLGGLLWHYDLFLLLGRRADTLDWQAVSPRTSRWRVRAALCFRLPHGSRRATRASAPLSSPATGRTAGAWGRC